MAASRLPLFAVLLLALAAGLLLTRTGRADPLPYEMRFITLSGESSNTKAWYEGAPPSGAKVQETLDRFAREGFRFASLSPTWKSGSVTVSPVAAASISPSEPTFVLLLERGSR